MQDRACISVSPGTALPPFRSAIITSNYVYAVLCSSSLKATWSCLRRVHTFYPRRRHSGILPDQINIQQYVCKIFSYCSPLIFSIRNYDFIPMQRSAPQRKGGIPYFIPLFCVFLSSNLTNSEIWVIFYICLKFQYGSHMARALFRFIFFINSSTSF